METAMTINQVASRHEWLTARAALLEREKAHTRAPRGRNEDEGWQLWIRRHDEYR